MKKEVWINIASSQQFGGCEEENINLVTAGLLYEKNGKYYISYDESELTGLDGTRTTVKLAGKAVSLIRTGTYPAHMIFDEDKRHVGLYHTAIGSAMTIATHTSNVENTIGENGGKITIDYTTEIDGDLMGRHHFTMQVSASPIHNITGKAIGRVGNS